MSRDQTTLDDELTPASVTVEHVFPKSSSSGLWAEIAEADADWEEHYIFRLGNICLLPGINHSLGNKEFPEKQEIYRRSLLRTTKDLGRSEQWGRPEIMKRQQHMAQLATSAWRFQ